MTATSKPAKRMNSGAFTLIWVGATVSVSMLAAVLIHPAVLIGVIVGILMTELKNVAVGE